MKVTNGSPILTLRVLSYNILAGCYTGLKPQNTYYKGMELNVLTDFEYRSQRILREIAETDADIICLQEVDHWDDVYRPQLEDKMGYACQMTYRKNKDAVLVGWKKDKFELQAAEFVNINDVATNFGSDASLYRKGNVGVICILKHRDSGKKLVAMSSHLYWNVKKDFVKYA